MKLLWNRSLLCVIALVMVVLAGCGGGGAGGGGGPRNSDASIHAFIARYVGHTKAKDSQALSEMYTDPAEWTDVLGTRTLSRADIKAEFDMVYAIVTNVYDSQAKDVSVKISGDTATVEFTWVQDVHNSVLDLRVETEGDMKWILKRIGGEWYISHAISQVRL